MILLLYIVIQLLGHGVVEREALVGTKDVTNEAQAEGQVGTESLESVRDGFAGRRCCLALAALAELHGEVGVLWVDILFARRLVLVVRDGIDGVECARHIIGFVFVTGLQLGHVRHVDPAIVPEGDRVLEQRVGLALVHSTVQLDIGGDKL